MAESRKERLHRLLERVKRQRLDAQRGRDQTGVDPAVRVLFAAQEQVYAEIASEVQGLVDEYSPRDKGERILAAARRLAVSASRCRSAAEALLMQTTHPLYGLPPVERAEREALRDQARLFQHAADTLAAIGMARRLLAEGDGGALHLAASSVSPVSQ